MNTLLKDIHFVRYATLVKEIDFLLDNENIMFDFFIPFKETLMNALDKKQIVSLSDDEYNFIVSAMKELSLIDFDQEIEKKLKFILLIFSKFSW
jgi:hypothetical protein